MKNESRCDINYPTAYQPGVYLLKEFTPLASAKTDEHTASCWHVI